MPANPHALGWRSLLLALGLFSAALAVGYGHGLNGPFVFDDLNLRNNTLVRITELGELPALFATRSFPRKVGMATFALNHLADGFDPFGYHLVNLALHLVNGLLLFALLHRLFTASPDHPWRAHARLAALAGSGLWLAHPVQTQAVSYIWQRFTVLAASCYLAGLLCYVEWRLRGRKILLVPCALLFLLGLGVKENAATLPLAIVLVELLLLRGAVAVPRRQLLLTVGVAVVAVASVAAVFLGPRFVRLMNEGARLRGFTLAERGLTQFRVLVHYETLIAFPHPSRLNLDYDIEKSTGLLTPPTTLPSLVFVVAQLGLALLQARRRPLLSFALLWFFGHLAIESSIIPLDMVYEHRLYLPSAIPIAFLCAWLLHDVLTTAPARLALAVVAGAFVSWSAERNRLWADPVLLWKDNAAKSPRKARVFGNLARAYLDRGEIEKARIEFQHVVSLDPDLPGPYSDLALTYMDEGKNLDKAKELLREAERRKPNYAPVQVNLGVIFAKEGDHVEAARHFARAFELDASRPEAYSNLGFSRLYAGETARARELALRGLEIWPREARLHYLLGSAYRAEGDSIRAQQAFRRADELRASTSTPPTRP